VSFDPRPITQIIVKVYPRIIDEDIERIDLVDSLSNLRCIGHV
jgi:hypothetical protein